MGQATVPANSTVAVFTMPAGLATFTVFQPTNAQVVYLGTSSKVSASNGMPVPVTPIVQENYNTVRGGTFFATTGNGTASSFNYLISTAN